LWLLGLMPKSGETYVTFALDDPIPEIRMTGLRLARSRKMNVIPLVEELVRDPSPQVRRECALALRKNPSGDMPRLWSELAAQHDGKDRWYLEALGIAAEGRWDDCLEAWLASAGDNWKSAAGRDVVWRSRAKRTPELLASLISDPQTPEAELPRYLRAFDFLDDKSKQPALLRLVHGPQDRTSTRNLFSTREALVRLTDSEAKNDPKLIAVLNDVLDQSRGTELFLDLIQKFHVADRNADLVALAQAQPDQKLGVQAIRMLLSQSDTSGIEQGLKQKDVALALKTVQAVGNSESNAAMPLLWRIVDDKESPVELQREAVRGLARFKNSAKELLDRAESNKLDSDLKEAAAASLHLAPWSGVKSRAEKIFPPPPSRNEKPLPPLAELVGKRGDSIRGRMLFHTTGTCAKCHVVDGLGREVGPNLSEIGDKLSRQACYESIVYPSAGISHNYETHVAVLESGNVATGILISRTPESITLRGADAIERTIRMSEIEELRKQNISLMPADLQKTLSEDELVDVVEYLTILKKRLKTGGQ
ncbi:MAG: dehydrogenase, partial [Planctomycetaceae bacterium]